MIEKISFAKIWSSHFETMRNYKTNKTSGSDVFIFFILPVFVALTVQLNYALNKDILNSILTSASVFAGLLLNLLVLIYSISEKFKQSNNWEAKALVLQQTFSNISFSILISVFLIVACLFSFRTDEELKTITLSKYISDFLVCYLTTTLIFHLLMILKRVHLLMDSELPA